jgi:hypothetical protein
MYSAAITICEKGMYLMKSMMLSGEVQGKGLEQYVIAYSATLGVPGQMQHKGLELHVITYCAAISACEKGKHL